MSYDVGHQYRISDGVGLPRQPCVGWLHNTCVKCRLNWRPVRAAPADPCRGDVTPGNPTHRDHSTRGTGATLCPSRGMHTGPADWATPTPKTSPSQAQGPHTPTLDQDNIILGTHQLLEVLWLGLRVGPQSPLPIFLGSPRGLRWKHRTTTACGGPKHGPESLPLPLPGRC